jgi:large subunit ribosomal protein L25
MSNISLNLEYRDTISKSGRSQLRKKGLIPAIFYGKNIKDNLPVAVDPVAVKKIIKSRAGANTFIDLTINKNGETIKHLALIKEVQMHPIYRMPVHVDFYAIEEKEEIEVDVAVEIVGAAPGVKEGGILQLIRKELTVKCLPQYLPEKIEIDVSNLNLHEAIHVEDIKIENVQFIYDTNFTILTIVPPAKEKSEIEEEEEEETVEE